MDKENLKKQIDGAYSMITSIYVKGAGAKCVAIAMQHLENALAELDKPNEPPAKEGKTKLEKESEVING